MPAAFWVGSIRTDSPEESRTTGLRTETREQKWARRTRRYRRYEQVPGKLVVTRIRHSSEQTTRLVFLNSQELHQTGVFSQVAW